MTAIKHFSAEKVCGQQLSSLQELMSRTFTPHKFHIEKTSHSSISFGSVPFGGGSISELAYTVRTDVSCYSVVGYYVILVKRGQLSLSVDGEEYAVRPGQGFILSQGQTYFRRSGSEGAEMVVLKLNPSQLHQFLPFEAETGFGLSVRFVPRFSFAEEVGGTLWRAIEFTRNELLRLESSGCIAGEMLKNYETFVIKTLIDSVGFYVEKPETSHGLTALPGNLRAVIALMDTYCHEPLRLSDLCEVAEVKARTLNADFHKYFSISPMQYLKRLRLQRVNQELLCSGGETTVTQIATRWGFTQLGWFSREYRKIFGEAPSETLRNNKI